MPTGPIVRLRASLASRIGFPLPVVSKMIVGDLVRIRYGSYPEEADSDYAWQAALARHSSVVFDIRANQGQPALNVLLGGRAEELVLVEANPQALAVAAENLIRKGLSSRVRFVTGFVGARAGDEVELHVVGVGSAGSIFRSHSVTAAKAGSSIRARTLTVDSLVESLGLVPDLVIIDVEGAERAVLQGAAGTVSTAKQRLLVEMHSPEELGGMRGNANKVLDWCQEAGYKAWYLAEGKELKAAREIAHRGRCHLLLQMCDWDYPDWLQEISQASSIDSARETTV